MTTGTGFDPEQGFTLSHPLGAVQQSGMPIFQQLLEMTANEGSYSSHPDYQIDVQSDRRFDSLPDFSQNSARIAEMLLNMASNQGLIDLAQSRNIMEFGAGKGGPTLALARLARLNDGAVEAVEKKPEGIQHILDKDILPSWHAHVGDGLEYLWDARSRARFDLVAAFMFGPDIVGGLSSGLLSASRHALRTGGHMLISSDYITMRTVRTECDKADVPYEEITGVIDPGIRDSHRQWTVQAIVASHRA